MGFVDAHGFIIYWTAICLIAQACGFMSGYHFRGLREYRRIERLRVEMGAAAMEAYRIYTEHCDKHGVGKADDEKLARLKERVTGAAAQT